MIVDNISLPARFHLDVEELITLESRKIPFIKKLYPTISKDIKIHNSLRVPINRFQLKAKKR
jgi:hypothetical protein